MVMSVDDVRRAITRIAHEILERQQGSASLALVGLQRGGAWLADAIAAAVNVIEPHATVPVGYIDVSMHRDDIGLRPVVPGAISRIDFAVDGTTVVLVDDGVATHSEGPWAGETA
jgi:pyrimidine operon attenuation protein/uracil phosphoribosyltransferase